MQDNEIVKVTSPADHSVTNGHLCVKGRFGFQYVQNRGPGASRAIGRRLGGTSLSQTSAGATGIVLAGGRSTRFGSDKLAALVDGVPLLHHPVLRLAEVCREVLVVVAPGAPDPALPLAAPVRLVRDATEGRGPAGRRAGRAHRDRDGLGARRRRRHAGPADLGPAGDAAGGRRVRRRRGRPPGRRPPAAPPARAAVGARARGRARAAARAASAACAPCPRPCAPP